VQVPTGIIRRGHFAFSSGFHGDTWLDLDAFVADAPALRSASEELAQRLARYDAAVVCGPLDGGAFVAHFVAAALGRTFVYADPAHRYDIKPAVDLAGCGVVVVDDAINAGSAVVATVQSLRDRSADVVAVASLIVCQPAGGRVGGSIGVPQHHLQAIDTTLWLAESCPTCASGVDVVGA